MSNPKVLEEAIQQHVIEKQRLVETLKKYAQCRHGEINCNCTAEARKELPQRIYVSLHALKQALNDGAGSYYPNFSGDPDQFQLATYMPTPKYLVVERWRQALTLIRDKGWTNGCGRASCSSRKIHDDNCPVTIAATALNEPSHTEESNQTDG